MSGLFRRLSSRRSDGPEGEQPPAQAEPGAADAPANAPADAGGHRSLLVDPAAPTRVLRDDEAPTTVQRPGEAATAGETGGAPAPIGEPPAHGGGAGAAQGGETGSRAGAGGGGASDPASTLHPVVRLHAPGPGVPYGPPRGGGPMIPVSDLPAGVDPDELAAAPPTSARRSRLRRRVGFLRAAREVLLRDLGGFVYELHRTAGDIEHEAHRRLREVKLARLTRLDAELHELEARLDDVRRHVVVREPGVGGECPRCGELFGSDAHYCAHCGLPLTESARRAVARETTPPALAAGAPPEPMPPPDQATEEYSPLAAGDTEFRWPSRAAAADEATTAVEPAGHAAGEPATGETAPEVAAGEDAPATRATGPAPAEATAGDDRAQDDERAAPQGAEGDEPVDAAAEGAARERGADHEASVEAAAGEDEPVEAAAGDDTPATRVDPAQVDARPADSVDSQAAERNGRDESVFGPMERRR